MSDKGFNLAIIDEDDREWTSEILSPEFYDRLNKENTVLLVRNFAVQNMKTHRVLDDIVYERKYAVAENDEAVEKLENLLFTVAINDYSVMHWHGPKDSFVILHEDESQTVFVDERRNTRRAYNVVSRENKLLYRISEDKRAVYYNIDDTLSGFAFPSRRKRRRSNEGEASKIIRIDCTEKVYEFFKKHLSDFAREADCIVLKTFRALENDRYVIDANKLLEIFPKLSTVCCKDTFEIINSGENVCTLDPFELGELGFCLAQKGDIETANRFARCIGVLDRKWDKFFLEVAKDFNKKPEDHLPEFDENGSVQGGGMDDLFCIYFFGWFDTGMYSFDKKDGFVAEKYKNIDKAIAVIPTRFKNCYSHEIGERLFWDTEHFRGEATPDYDGFCRVLLEAEKHFPGAVMGFIRMTCYYGCSIKEPFLKKLANLLDKVTKDGDIIKEFYTTISEQFGQDVAKQELGKFI